MASLLESIFGFKIKANKPEPEQPSFTPEITDDGAVVVASGGAYGTYIDLEGTAKSDVELVNRYRTMAQTPEVDRAIDDILNEAIVTDEDYIVKIVLDKVEGLSAPVKKKVEAEFEYILGLLEFESQAYETFRRWYVDGRLYYHVIIDGNNQKNGITELKYIDPRKIRKIREVEEIRSQDGYSLQRTKEEYYVYNEKGFNTGGIQVNNRNMPGLKILPDAICYTTSGVTDENNTLVYSHLHKAIKPLNNLKILEDATVIYRISRAPERLIFYIDVGMLPKTAADQYVREQMSRYRNRLVYDQKTGEIRDDRKYMTMQENYWFPRREGGKGTEIVPLQGGQNLGELTDVEYFQKQLYMSLNIPVSRLEPDLGMTLGRATEISRDEVKFSKFVSRLRRRFNMLFLKLLEKQLVMKRIILPEEWAEISRKIEFDYIEDNHFTELKNLELYTGRAQGAMVYEPFIGKAVSWKWVRTHILFQTEDEMEQIDKEIAEEAKDPNLITPSQMQMMQLQADIEAKQNEGQDGEDDEMTDEPIESQDDPQPDEEQQALDDNNIGSPINKPPGAKKDEPKKKSSNK